jgi:hypothetical protein
MYKELSEDIEKALSVARFAPSSHNTQPWTVKLYDNYIEVGYDPNRQLSVGDPDKRELFISLGCFIESLRIASSELGLLASTTFRGTSFNLVAKVDFKKQSGLKLTNLSSVLIKKRRSDRRLYDKKEVPKDVISSLESIGDHSAFVNIYNKDDDIKFFSEATYKATLEAMSEQTFRNELASWVRHNWTQKLDGMPAYTQGMPGLISLIAKPMIKKNKKVAISQAKKDSKRITRSSFIALVCSKDDTPTNLLKAGADYQDLCLMALDNDIKTSGISAAVISPSTAKEIIDRFKLDSIPVALIRGGYRSGSVKAAPRLSHSSIII